MSEGDEMESAGGTASEGSNSQCRNNMKRVSKEDTFVSASDLSSYMDNNSRMSSSNSESTSNSASSSFNNSNSSSAYGDNSSSNSSSQSGLNGKTKTGAVSNHHHHHESSNSDNTEDVEKPVFATCSSVATSISSSATTVRRCESWSALRSTSFDSSKNESEADNNDDRTSVTSMNDQSYSESHPLPPEFSGDTYHTPNASLHNIAPLKLNVAELKHEPVPERQEFENLDSIEGEMEEEGETHTATTTNADFTDENCIQQTGNAELEISNELSKSTEIITSAEEDDNNKKEEKDESELDKQPDSKLEGELIQSIESNTSKESSGSTTKDVQVMKQMKFQEVRGKPTKKKMWYQQIFSASYKSRSGDFKKLFKDLPGKERLLVDYSCALQKEILVQGRMYVSQGFLSFHANIFGWETQSSIRLKEITSITKEKTALVIPNAIQIMTDTGEKYFFTSFVTRDATYMMLFKLWQSALLEDSMPSREVQRLIHSCYGEELVITSEDETEDILSCKSALLVDTIGASALAVYNLADSKSIEIDQRVCSSELGVGPAITVTGNLGSSIVTANVLASDLQQNGIGVISMEHTDLSDTSDSDEEFQNPEGILDEEEESFDIPICPTPHSDGRETINTLIPCNIDQLFTMLFTNSKFYLDLHTARKTFDINQSPWEIGKDGKKTRQVSMTVSLSAVMGPKHSQVTETQVMLPVSKPGLFYVIESESVNAGIPYADTFYVTIHYCLSRVSANESKLVVVNQVKYKKSAWGITKSIIEKNCWAGIEEFYSHLERALKEECAKMILGASPVPSPKISAANLPRRRPPRNKRKAPDVPICVTPLIPRNSLRNGSIPGVIIGKPQSPSTDSLKAAAEGSVVLKVILSVLACLLLLNAFLYFKLTRLETTATSPTFPPHSFTFSGEIPQNHQDWLTLLQKQEVLHRIELQKWHEILMSALKILHQAESDLEALKSHIGSYNGGKYSLEILKQQQESSEASKSTASQIEVPGSTEKEENAKDKDDNVTPINNININGNSKTTLDT